MRVSIKLKFSVFLAALLILTVVVLSSLVQRGIERNQQSQIEGILSQQTRLVNLNVRQAYYTESVHLEQDVFLQQNGRRLAQELANSTGLPIALYDMNGQQVGSSISSGRVRLFRIRLTMHCKIKLPIMNKGIPCSMPHHWTVRMDRWVLYGCNIRSKATMNSILASFNCSYGPGLLLLR
ncbi:hypothetical protein MT997_01275 [Paenibacillus sp. OVF10]|nr:hypothetical protein MT997_01275 [Paenibacillus sp. OVF10]